MSRLQTFYRPLASVFGRWNRPYVLTETMYTEANSVANLLTAVGQLEKDCAIASLKSGETTEAFLVSIPFGHLTDGNVGS